MAQSRRRRLTARLGRAYTRASLRTRQALAALLLLAVGPTGCSQTPDAGGETTVDVEPRPGLPFPDSDAGRAVASHLDAMFAIGPNAEASYQASLAALRARGGEAIAALVATYDQADKNLYNERAALVETLAALWLPQAREALLAIANEPLPERVPAPDETMQPIGPEIVIRTTAIRGLGNLAERDDVAARALAALAKHRELALQEQAKQSLAVVIAQEKDRLRRQRLIELLADDYRDWLPLQGVTPPAPSRN